MADIDFSSVDLIALLNRDAQPSRVPNFLVNSKQQAHYTPQFISLGPYHCDNRKLKDAEVEGVDRISSNDLYKRMFVRKQLKIKPPNAKSLDDMVQVPIIEIERFYNLAISKGENSRIAQMMLMDSLFLLCFLSTNNGDHGDYDVVIKCDILKLDNQIPLFVLKDVCKFVQWNHPMATLLLNAYTELSPFDLNAGDENPDTLLNNALNSEHHLLGCIHAIVSRFLEIKGDSNSDSDSTPTLLPIEGDSPSPEPTPTLLKTIFSKVRNLFFSNEGNLPIKGYNAVQLASAGIKFKPFSPRPYKIRFDKGSHTLYLPQMTVSSVQTEVFFRNLVAMEFNESINSDKHVTRFIQLTDCLIDTADDVNVLRKSQVITSESKITDENIAIIWKSLHHPFYRGHIQPPEQLKSALDDVLGAKNSFNYCKIKIRIVLWEFFYYYYQKYFSHPWSFLAMLAGIFLLALTLIQTYCSLQGYSSMIKLYANL